MKEFYILFAFLLTFVSTSISSIKPSQYIWMNYGPVNLRRQIPGYYIITLPCRTRIGTCSYSYSLVPPEWIVLPNGDLKIPVNSVSNVISYSIQGTFSQPTGEQIKVSLIAEMNNNQMIIQDRGIFFEDFDYQPEYTTNKPSGIQNHNSDNQPIKPEQTTPKNQPQKVPTPKLYSSYEIRQFLTAGNIQIISQNIQNVRKSAIDCSRKKKYIAEVLNLVKVELSRRQNRVELARREIQALQFELSILIQQKNTANSNKQTRQQQIQQQINYLQNLITSARKNQKKYQQFAQNYLAGIKKQSSQTSQQSNNNKTQQNLTYYSYKDQETQIQMINSAIKQLLNRKRELQKQIAEKKLKNTVENIVNRPENLQSLQERYRYYSELAIKARIQAQDYQYQLQAIQSRQSRSEDSLKITEQAIQRLQQKIRQKQQNNGTPITEVQAKNISFENTLRKIQASKQSIENQCPASF